MSSTVMAANLKSELELACTAVQHCAVLTQRIQNETLRPEGSVKKSDFSPVTIGDFAVQALLTAAVRGAFKDDKFLAEESADELRQNESLLDQVWQLVESVKSTFTEGKPTLNIPHSKEDVLDLIDAGGKNESSNGPRTWVFDPIDGTATFMRGQQYAINCAFLLDGREEIGIIGCPNIVLDSSTVHEDDIDKNGLGVMIFAIRGEGTWTRPMQDNGKLAPATRVGRHGEKATMDKLVWSDCSTYTSTIIHLHEQIAAKLNTSWPGVDLYSSLMKYAALGLGRCDLVIRVFKYASWRSNMWDHAGGVLIYEEAGGKVTDLNGKGIDFSTGRKMSANYGLVCAPSSVHPEVLKVIQEAVEAHGPIPWSR